MKELFSSNSMFLILKAVSCFPSKNAHRERQRQRHKKRFPHSFHNFVDYCLRKRKKEKKHKRFFLSSRVWLSCVWNQRKGSKSNSHCWYNITFLFKKIIALERIRSEQLERWWETEKKTAQANVNRFFILI